MKRFFIRESSNLVCFLRLFGSIAFVAYGIYFGTRKPVLALIFSLLLISDLFDGYLYRNYVAKDPPKHWFNRLPVTLDPLSDLVFTISGAVYILHDHKCSLAMIVGMPLWIIAIALILSIMIEKCGTLIRHIATALLTYGCYVVMVLNVAWVWRINTPPQQPWWVGFIGCMVTFYLVFFTLVPQERWLRY